MSGGQEKNFSTQGPKLRGNKAQQYYGDKQRQISIELIVYCWIISIIMSKALYLLWVWVIFSWVSILSVWPKLHLVSKVQNRLKNVVQPQEPHPTLNFSWFDVRSRLGFFRLDFSDISRQWYKVDGGDGGYDLLWSAASARRILWVQRACTEKSAVRSDLPRPALPH